ncbi:6-phosphogluconolactonase/glucosamine-6-phosphate isomerase/deaminase, partial [Mucilaginibacter sp. AK015]|nr:6-phosphogluconolactonase/glucosamine-6-phosphate isomerase/deaminase [Mucilaginibacter sp. AK015]
MARLNLLEETRYEKLPVTVYADQNAASVAVAKRIAGLIRKKEAAGQQAVLGLATGVTP